MFSEPLYYAFLVLFDTSLLCALNAFRCLLDVCFWCYSLLNCCVILVFFGALLLCILGVFQCLLAMNSWCCSLLACCVLLMIFNVSLLHTGGALQCFLVCSWFHHFLVDLVHFKPPSALFHLVAMRS